MLRIGMSIATFSPRSSAGLRKLDQAVIERAREAVVLLLAVVARHLRADLRLLEYAREVQPLCLPVGDALFHLEQVGAADQLVHAAHAELRHDLARLFGDEEEVVDHVLGLALEFLAQHRILRGHAHRAGIEMAFAHHDAAFDHQRRGGEAEFVRAEHGADDHVAPGLDLAVDLHRDAPAQAVEHQRLLRFREAQLPRRAGVLDRRPGRCAGAAVVAGDGDMVGLGLGHACRDGADADLGHELDADRGLRIGVLQVVDQLRQILDRIDVVMRRRRNQAHARVPRSGSARCTRTPCGRAAGRPRRAWRPAPS